MKSKTRKVLALLLCLLVCLGSAPAAFALGERTEARWPVPPAPSAGDGAFPGTADRVFAAADSYNAAAAASYALKWWNSFNMQWYNWEAESYSDCANFVSQCLYAGGMKMSADWYWISRDNYNDAWTTAHKLAVYLASKGYAFELFPTAGQISLGDVLFYDWNQDGTFDHSAICVNDSGDSRYVCCHSNAHCTADYTLGAARYMVIRLNGTRGTVYPGKPALTGMSASYEAGKPITFTWEPTENTTYYKLLLGKKSASGAYELAEQYQNVQSGFKLTLEVGEYAVLLKAYNGNSQMPDGSDYANTTAEAVYFSVNKASFTVTYDANGGTGAPGAQTKAPGTALTLAAAIPTREGSYFLGWAESRDATRAAYLPGTSYTADASATLYAVWVQPDLVLPEALTTLETGAFEGGAFRFAQLSEKTEEIGARAFADCPQLKYVFIPRACTRIDQSAFEGVSGATVFGARGSTAEIIAWQKGFTFLPVN